MEPFITFREPDHNGVLQYYIGQRAYPHFVGMIIDNPAYSSLVKVAVPMTTLYICLEGTIRGRLLPSYTGLEEEIKGVLSQAADWFYKNRILENEKKYKKWLLFHY